MEKKNKDYLDNINLDDIYKNFTLDEEKYKYSIDALTQYHNQIQDYEPLSAEDEYITAVEAKNGSQEARKKLINHNTLLVVYAVKRYANKGFSLETIDLINEGNLGLIEAVDKFDPYKGYRFSTYAYWWIKRAIYTAIVNKNNLITIPIKKQKIIKMIKDYILNYETLYNTKPTYEEISNGCNIRLETVKEYLGIFIPMLDNISLNTKINDDEFELGDNIASEELSPEEETINNNQIESLNETLPCLNKKQRQVIDLRYGLIDGIERTYLDIGKELKLSPERTRQINEEALRKLRKPKNIRKYENIQ